MATLPEGTPTRKDHAVTCSRTRSSSSFSMPAAGKPSDNELDGERWSFPRLWRYPLASSSRHVWPWLSIETYWNTWWRLGIPDDFGNPMKPHTWENSTAWKNAKGRVCGASKLIWGIFCFAEAFCVFWGVFVVILVFPFSLFYRLFNRMGQWQRTLFWFQYLLLRTAGTVNLPNLNSVTSPKTGGIASAWLDLSARLSVPTKCIKTLELCVAFWHLQHLSKR